MSKKIRRHRMLRAWVLLFMGSLMLLGAVLVQFLGARKRPAADWVPLARQLPSVVSGWTVKDIPVADSPEVQKAAETILRYDDVVFREYRSGSRSLQVYASAWLPGKMDARDLAIHNPDNCWTANGFTRLEAASKNLTKIGDYSVAAGNFRRFAGRDKHLEVAYWLIVDGRSFASVDESTRAKALLTRLISFCRTVWFRLVSTGKRTPTYFVRLSSPQELEASLEDPELRSLVNSLSPLIAGMAETR